jgi:hypothetical protein
MSEENGKEEVDNVKQKKKSKKVSKAELG